MRVSRASKRIHLPESSVWMNVFEGKDDGLLSISSYNHNFHIVDVRNHKDGGVVYLRLFGVENDSKPVVRDDDMVCIPRRMLVALLDGCSQ